MITNLSNAERVRVPGERLYEQDIYAKDLDLLQAKTLQRLSASADVLGIIKLLGENLNIDINTMYVDDFKYLIHWFRLKSFSDFPHMVSFTCNHCNKSNELPVKSENLVIDDVPNELTKDGGVLMAFENYPKGLYIRAPKVGDDFITNALMKKLEISEEDLDSRSLILDLNLFRNKVNGLDIEDLYKTYKEGKFTTNDLMCITAFKQTMGWGVRDEYKFKCEHCKEEVTVIEPLDLTTFFLSGESRRLIRSRILPILPLETTDNGAGEAPAAVDQLVLQETRKNAKDNPR